MKRTKFTVSFRNELASMICDFDSAACIEDGGMTADERKEIQEKLRKILNKVDKKIAPKKRK